MNANKSNVMSHDANGNGKSENATAAEYFGCDVILGRKLTTEECNLVSANSGHVIENEHEDEIALLLDDATGLTAHLYCVNPLAVPTLIEETQHDDTLCRTLLIDKGERRLLIKQTSNSLGIRDGWMIAQVRNGDTIEGLENEEWNATCSVMEALFFGYSDAGRFLMDWNETVIDRFVDKVDSVNVAAMVGNSVVDDEPVNASEYNANDELSYGEMEALDDCERTAFDNNLTQRDLVRIDHGNGYTIGWLYAKDGQRLDDPATGNQPRSA